MTTWKSRFSDGPSTTDAWAPRPPGLSAASTATPVAVRVVLEGELDIATVPIAERELRRAQDEAPHVLLDLRGLTFIDARGLDMVMTADRRARATGRALTVCPGSRCVRRLFALTGVDRSLAILDVVAAAPESQNGASARPA